MFYNRKSSPSFKITPKLRRSSLDRGSTRHYLARRGVTERVRTIKESAIRALKWVRTEVRATRPIFCFFLTGFLLILLIVKLTLAQYSIGLNALSRALLGAALAAKVVLLLENTPVGRPFSQLPRIVPILFKSVVYGASVICTGLPRARL